MNADFLKQIPAPDPIPPFVLPDLKGQYPPAEPAVTEPKEEGSGRVQGADKGVKTPESPLMAFKAEVFKRTGKHHHGPGRPSKHQKKAEKKLKAKTPPPVPPQGRNWGGKRRGSGRPKRIGPPSKKQVMVRMDKALASKLETLPQGAKSEYITKALELMTDIQSPEKFLASGRKKKEPETSL